MKIAFTLAGACEQALKVKTQAAADELLDGMAQYLFLSRQLARKDALQLARFELGYYAGYANFDTRVRVEKLFDAPHPFLGSVFAAHVYSPLQILNLGFDVAEALLALREETAQWELEHA